MARVEKAKTKRKNTDDYTVEFVMFFEEVMSFVWIGLTSLFSLGWGAVLGRWVREGALMFSEIQFYIVSMTLFTCSLFLSIYLSDWVLEDFYLKLVVSPEGIQFHRLNKRKSIHWRQMQRLDIQAFAGVQTWTLHYDHRKSQSGKPDEHELPGSVSFGIKRVRLFRGKWDLERFKTTPLGEAFRYYAPWLFEPEVSEKHKGVGDDIH